jgi:hypothetical protein
VKKTTGTITGDPTDDWTFKWVDEIVDASGTVTATSYSNSGTAQEAASLSDLTLTAVGHHKVYLAAYYDGATTPTATSEELEFYVIKDNPTTISATDKTYDGTQIANPTESSGPNPNVTPAYSYYLTSGGDAEHATSGLPTDAGAYTVIATFPEDLNLGLKETKANTTVTISQATITIDAGEKDVAAYTAENASKEYEVDLSGFISKYEKKNEKATVSAEDGAFKESNNTTYLSDVTFTESTQKLTFKLNTTTTGAQSGVTISGKLATTNYNLTVKYTVNVIASGTDVYELTADPLKTYYGDYDTTTGPAELEKLIKDKPTGGTYTYTYVKQDSTGTKPSGFPTDVGTYTVKISYSRDANDAGVTAATGKGTAILTINPKPLTITATAQTINVGETFKEWAYTFEADDGNKLTTIPAGLNPTAKVTNSQNEDVTASVPTTAAATFTLTFTYTASDNYTVTVKPATLTVKGTTTYTPASGTITDKDKDKDKDKTPSDSTATDTTTLTIQKNADGSKTVVDDKGNVVANKKVTVAGKSYITDKDGKVITSDKVTIDGKSYITDKNGVIETGKVTKTPSGNKVYVDKDGAIVKNKTVSYKGKKYYATKTGKIATSGFVKTARGNTVYATKSGVLKVNKAFKASNGKKYVADKNGKIVKGKKYTIGNKTYTTNKKGVITKVTTKKK